MGIKTQPPVNGDFVNEGTFLALPPCFPGVSLPPPADETRAHRLLRSATGRDVFVASRGPVPHLLQFRPKGTFWYAVDIGTPPDAAEITALMCDDAGECLSLLVACKGEESASIYRCRPALMETGIQEWRVHRHTFEWVLTLPIASIDGVVGSESGMFAWGDKMGFFLNRYGTNLVLEKTVPLHGVLAALKLNGADHLISKDWRLLPIRWDSMSIGEGETLPIHTSLPQALHVFAGGFVFADGEGRIFEWSEGRLFLRGSILLAPVNALARLPDGRIFASAGAEIAHWYVLTKEVGWARDLGVPVSTLTTRRYGLLFADLLVGCDGEILAAENDRNGHLWIYFPPLQEMR